MMVYRIMRGQRGLILIGVAAVLTIAILFRGTVKGDGAEDAPDSNFIAQGPIANNETVNSSLADKTAQAQIYQNEYQTALTGTLAAKDPADSPPSSNLVGIPRVSGIYEGSGPMVGGTGRYYRFENYWLGAMGGSTVRIIAGSMSDDPIYGTWNTPEQGAVRVIANGTDDTQYLAPTRTGRLRVLSANGTCLSLRSTNNTMYQFDAGSRQWTCPPPSQSPPP